MNNREVQGQDEILTKLIRRGGETTHVCILSIIIYNMRRIIKYAPRLGRKIF